MRATRALKARSNGETKSKNTRKPKQAIVVHETNESESSHVHLPQSSIDNEVKAQEKIPEKKLSQIWGYILSPIATKSSIRSTTTTTTR
ncbi:hypothetical protein TanjilG_14181 [Lupinus angustifolius]|uniref:Uncharacterized protein n=1 Tax=Lupinus angustifolius TaxID=3871 RepID=A0A1J7HKD1_LUPAN|nr:hypothetical protein TanjilG_14181 [Lupinus angustifolius]